MNICVFGTYKKLGRSDKDIIKLGRLLAENGFTVVSGGFGGSMEQVSKGAKLGGGRTIGVTYYKKEDPPGKSANRFVDKEIKTGDIFRRISVMMDISDGFIVLQGGTGTLLELASVLEHINKGMMPPKPVVMVGSFWRAAVDTLRGEKILNARSRRGEVGRTCNDLVIFARDVNDAVQKIIAKLGERT